MVASPNYPGNYPNNVDEKETVKVERGKILRLVFTHFAIWVCGGVNTCHCDYVKIIDGSGATLMDKSCGYSNTYPSSSVFFKPRTIVTQTSAVEIFFRTNAEDRRQGWNIAWAAVTPG